jgi:hypothetical protein
MQTKRLFVLVAIVMAISITLFTFPTNAVAEEGTATLYLYTDPERTTLVELDSNERYYVVPGTEYYFEVSDITEYGIDESITIWACRTNTAENITIDNLKVNSVPFDAIFNWTIPDQWLDEVVKIKYGTSLENDWFYAQKEIWANARVGEAILYAYTDSARLNEAPLKDYKHYLVFASVTYYFTIDGITEYESMTIKVWARYQDTNEYIGDFSVGARPSTINFAWTIPDLPVDTEIKIKYGTDFKGPLEKWVFARRATESAPRLFFVIPEVFLGTIGAMAALFSGLGVTAFKRRKRILSRHSPY